MPFQVSPGVNVSEIDLTTVVPAVSTTEGAIAGAFHWGPVDQRILIDSETNLVNRFGKPSNHNAETFFTAANFLSYGNQLYVTRAANTTVSTTTTVTLANGSSVSLAANAIASFSAIGNTGAVSVRTKFNIKNRDDFDSKLDTFGATGDEVVLYTAKYPGSYGNSIRVSQCDHANQFSAALSLAPNTFIASDTSDTGTRIEFVVGSNSALVAVTNSASGSLSDAAASVNAAFERLIAGDVINAGNTIVGFQRLKVLSFTALDHADNSANLTSSTWTDLDPFSNSTHYYAQINFETNYTLAANVNTNSVLREWEYAYLFDNAPARSAWHLDKGIEDSTDEIHIVVADRLGTFSGTPGTILEAYSNLSRATDAKLDDGTANYYRDVINGSSNYVWVTNPRTTATTAAAATLGKATSNLPLTFNLSGGSDGLDESNIQLADLLRGYDQYKSAESVDVSLILQGKARGNNSQVANYIIDQIVDVRKDCVAFLSPPSTAVVRNPGNESLDINTFRNGITSSSYAVLDSGYKYQYDRYNDVYRYVPLNGDTAGLCVRTDSERDPWFSPAGFNRGQVKNIVKLAFNPSKADRDYLYKIGINPVVTFPGQGTVLFGDKTLLSRASAFDRINVRRLFIILEKSIAIAAKSMLFEFNDPFTRGQFKNMVEPFLRDIQGRRGIYDYKVVCDETNNTGEVIDGQRFVGDIYIKPARSINFIQLNFVAVRTGVEFSEIVGSV